MPNTTGSYPMPYPNSSAVPDVPGDLLALAQEVDDTLTAEFGALLTPGLVPIVPTSVSGTGVSVDAAGLVTFTAATTASGINVNGCFTSTYANYRLMWDIPTTSTNLNLTMQLRVAGTSAATAYDRLVNGGTGAIAAPTMANNLNQTSWQVAAATTAQHHSILELWRPAVAVGTVGFLVGSGLTNPPTAAGTFATQQSTLFHRTATAYDGFTIAPSTGTCTGTLRIYGYN